MGGHRGNEAVRRVIFGLLTVSLSLALTSTVPTAGASTDTATAAPATTATTTATAGPGDDELAADQAPIPERCGGLPIRGCRLKWVGEWAPTLVVWGDSHMWMMTPAIKRAVRYKRVNVVLFFVGGCVPAIPDMKIYAGNACAELSVDTMRYLQRLKAGGRPFRLLMGAYWGANLDRLYWYEDQESRDVMAQRRVYTMAYTRPLFRWLGEKGIPTDVSIHGPAAIPPTQCALGDTPFWCSIPRYRAYYKDGYVRNWLARQMSHLGGRPRLVDYTDGICSNRTCPAVVNGVHTWFDPYHVSATKAATLASYYKPSIRVLLNSR
jgi:hypothetical protein